MILIAMIEKARKILDRVGTFGVLLADLSKAFCYMTHDLITKHYVLTFDMNALNLIFDYMTGRNKGSKLITALADISIYFKVWRKDQF